MAKIAVFVDFKLKPGSFERFFELMKTHAAASRQEPGCLQFDMTTPLEGANRLMLYELYEDRAAFDYHASTERIKKHREATKDLITEAQLTLGELRDSGNYSV